MTQYDAWPRDLRLAESQPRTQAELDAYIKRYPRPVRNTYDGMFPLHEDMELSDEQLQIVHDYLREVDFHLPGATPDDFLVVRWARYVGFGFIQEDLEAYAVGLRCTRSGMEDQHTFIRMSWAQLVGEPDAPRLPVNEPVLASDMMTLARYRDTRTGPTRTGVDSYSGIAGDGVPGVDFDLTLIEGALGDILAHHETGQGREINSWWTPALAWGTVMAGRYPRLKYFESKGRLSDAERRRLHAFEHRAADAESILADLGLASPAPVADAALKQAKRAEAGRFLPRLRIRNPRPLTETRTNADPLADQRPVTDDRPAEDFPGPDDPRPIDAAPER